MKVGKTEALKACECYLKTKRKSKHTVYLVKSAAEKEEFATVSLNESNWRSWGRTDEATNRSCFQSSCYPRRLGGELDSKPPQRQRRSPKSWQLSRTETHRSSHEAGRTSARSHHS